MGSDTHPYRELNLSPLETIYQARAGLHHNGTSDFNFVPVGFGGDTFQYVPGKAWTLSIWVKPDGTSPSLQTIFKRVLPNPSFSVNDQHIWIYLLNDGITNRLNIWCQATITNAMFIKTSLGCPAGVWSHIVVTGFDHIASDWELYVNNVKATKSVILDGWNGVNGSNAYSHMALGWGYIGGTSPPTITNYFDGTMMDVTCSRKKWTDAEVAFVYNGGAPTDMQRKFSIYSDQPESWMPNGSLASDGTPFFIGLTINWDKMAGKNIFTRRNLFYSRPAMLEEGVGPNP